MRFIPYVPLAFLLLAHCACDPEPVPAITARVTILTNDPSPDQTARLDTRLREHEQRIRLHSAVLTVPSTHGVVIETDAPSDDLEIIGALVIGCVIIALLLGLAFAAWSSGGRRQTHGGSSGGSESPSSFDALIFSDDSIPPDSGGSSGDR